MAGTAHELLLPRSPGGMVPGAALALLAHAAMFIALTTVVQWRASAPEVVSAELWSAVPQIAAPPAPPAVEPAPRPVPAPPQPVVKIEPAAPDPQIAIAQAKAERERAEREKAERADKERQRKEREAQAEAKKREQLAREHKAEEERLAQQRQKNLERLMGQVGSAGGSGTAAQTSGPSAPSASYTGKLVAAIKPNIVFTDAVRGNPAAEVEVRAGPSGTIIARRLVRASGDKDWDEAVLRAIDRTGTLPRDVDGRVPPVITVVFRPQE